MLSAASQEASAADWLLVAESVGAIRLLARRMHNVPAAKLSLKDYLPKLMTPDVFALFQRLLKRQVAVPGNPAELGAMTASRDVMWRGYAKRNSGLRKRKRVATDVGGNTSNVADPAAKGQLVAECLAHLRKGCTGLQKLRDLGMNVDTDVQQSIAKAVKQLESDGESSI